jgi:hypothetical protein
MFANVGPVLGTLVFELLRGLVTGHAALISHGWEAGLAGGSLTRRARSLHPGQIQPHW